LNEGGCCVASYAYGPSAIHLYLNLRVCRKKPLAFIPGEEDNLDGRNDRRGVRSMAGRKGSSKGSSGKGKYRSSVTGRYVSSHYGKRHPKTTQREGK
jgi:hypothetical protein